MHVWRSHKHETQFFIFALVGLPCALQRISLLFPLLLSPGSHLQLENDEDDVDDDNNNFCESKCEDFGDVA